MPRNFITGVSGSVVYNSVTYCVVEHSITLEAPKIDTTNTCDVIGGVAYQSFINGPVQVSGSVKMYFDTNNNPFTSPTLVLGASATLTLNVGASGKAWVIPARIDKINMQTNVKNVITCDFDWSFNPAVGTLVYPS